MVRHYKISVFILGGRFEFLGNLVGSFRADHGGGALQGMDEDSVILEISPVEELLQVFLLFLRAA